MNTRSRLLELKDGALVAHGTICPHWLGPLEDAVPQNGRLRCPWHDYLFDVRTGTSADGHGYRLAGRLDQASGSKLRRRSGAGLGGH